MQIETQSNKISFKGETVFIGIDVHLRQWSVSVRTKHLTKRPFSQSPSARALRAYLDSEFPEAEYYSAYEAGFCGFAVHHDLEEMGIHNIVFNPADIADSQKERVRKTDSVDCAKISRNLFNGELTPIYVPGKEVEGHRCVLKLRANAVKTRTSIKNRIKGLLYRSGIRYPEEFVNPHSHWSKAFRDWLRQQAQTMPCGAEFAMLEMIEELESSNLRIHQYDKRLLQILKQDYAQMDDLLRSIPGIGHLLSAVLCFYLVDINRFKSDDELAAYIGMVPDTRSSGDDDRKLGITFRGNKILRPMIIEASWKAVAKDPALAAAFTAYCNRGLKRNVAIVHIARKLVNRIRYVLRTGNKYEYRVVK